MKKYSILLVGVICLFSLNIYAQVAIDPQMRHVHDPSMIYSDGYYYVYSTGNLDIRRSSNLIDWDYLGSIIPQIPQWVQDKIPGVSNIWAPDVTYHNGKYYICYSASTFGSQTSLLGLISNETLNPYSPDYQWIDEGEILSSPPTSSPSYNAIDGTFVRDASGNMWLVFGSYWDGIMLTPLDNTTLKPTTTPPTIHQLARRSNSSASEASYIIYHDGYYYLFVNWDSCCSGVDSTYKIIVGRSTSITGPYVDKNGTSLLYSTGGTLFVGNNARWIGPGHADITTVDGQDYFSYHTYDGQADGTPTLRINEMSWDQNGWPVLGNMVGEIPTEGTTVVHWNFEDGDAYLPFYDMPLHGSEDLINGYIMRGYDTTYGPTFAAETPTEIGLGAYCNGSQDGYILDAPLNAWSPSQWTIEISIMFNTVDGWNTFIGRDESSQNWVESDFYLQNDGFDDSFRLNLYTVGGERWVMDTSYIPDAGKWYHIALTSDGTVITMYCDSLDGNGYQVIDSLDISSQTVEENALAAKGVWTFGRGWYDGNLVDQIDGYFDNVRFSNVALSPSEFLFHTPVTITETDTDTSLAKTSIEHTDSYSIVLNKQPDDEVIVEVNPPASINVGNGSGTEKILFFNSYNWSQPQTITVSLEAGTDPNEIEVISNSFYSNDERFNALSCDVIVIIEDNICDILGYLQSDFNSDCKVDLNDFSALADIWLSSQDMTTLQTLAVQWLQIPSP